MMCLSSSQIRMCIIVYLPRILYTCGVAGSLSVCSKSIDKGNHYVYGSLPKTSNTLNIRTLKIIDKDNFKMVPKISNSG